MQRFVPHVSEMVLRWHGMRSTKPWRSHFAILSAMEDKVKADPLGQLRAYFDTALASRFV